MIEPAETYHQTVTRFKRTLLVHALAAHGGNRTRTARTLGLQRTYLLRLIREFGLECPPDARPRSNGDG